MNSALIKIPEPQLLFRHEQAVEDPRDGLMLFGPLDKSKPYGIRAGVVGTSEGIRRFNNWVEVLKLPVHDEEEGLARPPFLGFETVFNTPWSSHPVIELIISEDEIKKSVFLDDKYQRVYRTVNLYASRIIKAINEDEDANVDIWFVIVPDIVYQYCRPKSVVDPKFQIQASNKLNPSYAKKLLAQPSLLFPEENLHAVPYHYEVNFHNQLKARLLEDRALTQVIRESTIAPFDFPDQFGRPARGMDKLQASTAWNIATSVFYKVGGRPWKISGIREGVCYIGIVFKQTTTSSDASNACCAAQMFLDSGDGTVFKGDVGPWYNPKDGDFHLNRKAAKELVGIALDSYRDKVGKPPAELFLHGKIAFNDQEWQGFRDAIGEETNLVGVRIRDCTDIKLFRKDRHPVMRGLAYVRSKRTAYLWTRGYIPRLQTYPGLEVPNPLLIDVCRGNANLDWVLSDILALTKLNYNACIYADGVPVTLKFADAVGEILTAGPIKGDVPLPFKHYI